MLVVNCHDVTHMLCFDFKQFHQCLFHISAFFVRILLIVIIIIFIIIIIIIIILSTVLWSRSLAFVDCWHGSNRISRLIRPPRHCQAIVRHSAQNPGTYHLAGHWFNFRGEQLQRNICSYQPKQFSNCTSWVLMCYINLKGLGTWGGAPHQTKLSFAKPMLSKNLCSRDVLHYVKNIF